jgi:hypothetical protein
VAGADLRAAFVANCFRGAFPPVDLRAVYSVIHHEEQLLETIVVAIKRQVHKSKGRIVDLLAWFWPFQIGLTKVK